MNSHLGNFYLRNSKPDDIALIHHNQTITYGELDEKINRFASYLLDLGVKPGDRIALSCYNSPEFIYSYLAVTKVGAIIIPLNLMLTPDEIQFILGNAHTKILLVHEKVAKKLNLDKTQWKKGLGLQEILVLGEKTIQAIGDHPLKALPNVDPVSVSTLLYTSGTTGKPKGAMLSHNNLLANIHSCEVALEGNGKDVFLCALPMFHSFGFMVCVLLPLYVGSVIVIHDSFTPKEVMDSLSHKGITVFAAVPAMYIILSQALKSNPVQMSTLRVAVSGGAPLPVEILKLFNDEYQIPLLEGYGLTEASPVVSFNPLSGVKKAGSVGLPLQNIKVKIVNELGDELPHHEIGEILIHGPNVMLGYFQDPEESSKTVQNNWLNTGDMGYLDDDGYLFIVDRKKELIITRGLNVYPREVEEVLYTHPKVLEAAVIGVPDLTRGEIVKVVIVTKDHAPMDKKEVLDFLQNKIANYKLPRVIEFVDQLPKNASGKIIKKLLK